MKNPKSFKLNLSKFLQARFNVFIFRFLPFYASRLYLLSLGKLFYGFKKNEKKLIEKTINHVYQERLSPKPLKKLTKEVFNGIFTHYHEKLFVAYSNYPLLKKRFISWVNISGEKEFQKVLAEGKGIILVTAHYGAVEWLPGALAARGYPVTMILRFQTRKLKETLEKRSLEMPDLQLVDLDDGNVFSSAVKALKRGRILITECDEFDTWRKSKKNSLEFLYQKMEGDKTLNILQKHSGASVATALMHRESNRRYTLRLNTLKDEESADHSLSKLTMEALDKTLKESPEQWYQWKDFGEKLELNINKKIEDGFPEYLENIEENASSL